jgi:hypothetical protein
MKAHPIAKPLETMPKPGQTSYMRILLVLLAASFGFSSQACNGYTASDCNAVYTIHGQKL